MGLLELFFVAVSLSMDAFAVSVCKGLSVGRASWKHMLTAGAWFGGFQAAMPLAGYFLGTRFEHLIKNVDHWIAFGLLALIGASMIRESFQAAETLNDDFSPRAMLPLAVATSIDALAVGITFACLQAEIVPAVLLIGVTTFILSGAGVRIGNVFGAKYRSKAELAGGIILVLMGVKILLEHLGVLR